MYLKSPSLKSALNVELPSQNWPQSSVQKYYFLNFMTTL